MSETIFVQVNGQRVEATGDVLEEVLRSREAAEALARAAAEEAAAREAAKASALAKLRALGLTEDEAAAIAGL